jgi:hypothetical protein
MADEIAVLHHARDAAHRLAAGPAMARHRPGQSPARIHDLEAIRRGRAVVAASGTTAACWNVKGGRRLVDLPQPQYVG